MYGRRPIPEVELRGGAFGHPRNVQRRAVLADTLARLADGGRDRLQARAAQNRARWAAAAGPPAPRSGLQVRVVGEDWGVATLRLTRETGVCHAVLNMANAWLPGGRYIEGTGAQEENLFRRTDCAFSIDDAVRDPETDRYRPAVTARILAAEGRVLLDTATPRVCLRGPELREAPGLGYALLPDDEVFPFYELRAAAINGNREVFDAREARRRIVAQRDTLREAGVTHAVLSAFGCGAFLNPPEVVARLYREVFDEDEGGLQAVTFAILDSKGPGGNLGAFAAAFEGVGRG
ncbi:MAG: hypothetical protein RL071_2941 [Pseudomonadota bacterium]